MNIRGSQGYAETPKRDSAESMMGCASLARHAGRTVSLARHRPNGSERDASRAACTLHSNVCDVCVARVCGARACVARAIGLVAQRERPGSDTC
eukprot:4639207-Prymnesium_polylepis.1